MLQTTHICNVHFIFVQMRFSLFLSGENLGVSLYHIWPFKWPWGLSSPLPYTCFPWRRSYHVPHLLPIEIMFVVQNVWTWRDFQGFAKFNSRHTRKDFCGLKLQICRSNIAISISYLVIYSNLILKWIILKE